MELPYMKYQGPNKYHLKQKTWEYLHAWINLRIPWILQVVCKFNRSTPEQNSTNIVNIDEHVPIIQKWLGRLSTFEKWLWYIPRFFVYDNEYEIKFHHSNMDLTILYTAQYHQECSKNNTQITLKRHISDNELTTDNVHLALTSMLGVLMVLSVFQRKFYHVRMGLYGN